MIVRAEQFHVCNPCLQSKETRLARIARHEFRVNGIGHEWRGRNQISNEKYLIILVIWLLSAGSRK